MWQQVRTFLASRVGKAVVATGAVGAAVGLWWLWRKHPEKTEARDERYINIEIVPKHTLLQFFQTIREQYSKHCLSLKQQYRTQRRSLDPSSPAYAQCVLDFSDQTQALLQSTTAAVLQSLSLSETTVDRSLFYYVKDADIEAAKQLVNESINDTALPSSLTIEAARAVLTYFKTHLVARDEDGLDEYLVASAQVEDEVWREFGYESEQVEKAYELYAEELQEMTNGLVAQTRFVMQQTSEDSLGEDDPDS